MSDCSRKRPRTPKKTNNNGGPEVVRQGDEGRPAFMNQEETVLTHEFDKPAEQVANST